MLLWQGNGSIHLILIWHFRKTLIRLTSKLEAPTSCQLNYIEDFIKIGSVSPFLAPFIPPKMSEIFPIYLALAELVNRDSQLFRALTLNRNLLDRSQIWRNSLSHSYLTTTKKNYENRSFSNLILVQILSIFTHCLYIQVRSILCSVNNDNLVPEMLFTLPSVACVVITFRVYITKQCHKPKFYWK